MLQLIAFFLWLATAGLLGFVLFILWRILIPATDFNPILVVPGVFLAWAMYHCLRIGVSSLRG
jgi:hypothetical protein